MRTVSFFGPREGRIGGGGTEPDNGGEAAGGSGGGKKFVDETSSEADCGEEETGGLPVSRTGNWMPTVSFFGWSSSAITVGEIERKSRSCHDPILGAWKNVAALGQQIVA